MAPNSVKTSATILLSDLLRGLADAAVDRHSKSLDATASPDDRHRRHALESAFNLHGSPYPKDGTPGVLPRVLALIERGVVRPQSVENGFTCQDATQVQANPSKWYLTLDDAMVIRNDLLPMRPGDIVVSALLLELGQALAHSESGTWQISREDGLPSVLHRLVDFLSDGYIKAYSLLTDADQPDPNEVAANPDGYYLCSRNADVFRQEIERIENNGKRVRAEETKRLAHVRDAGLIEIEDAAKQLAGALEFPFSWWLERLAIAVANGHIELRDPIYLDDPSPSPVPGQLREFAADARLAYQDRKQTIGVRDTTHPATGLILTTTMALNTWLSRNPALTEFRFPEPHLAPATATNSSDPPSPLIGVKPDPVRQRQEKAILQALRDLKFDPKSLPKPKKNGGSGPKSVCWRTLQGDANWSWSKFKDAWERLRKDAEIIDAAPENLPPSN